MFITAFWLLSTVATYILAVRAELNKPAILALGNLALPGVGLLYVLYIQHIYIPRREGRIPPVMIFIRVFTEEITKSIKNRKK